MRLLAVLLVFALPASAQQQTDPPFLLTVTDPTNSHFAKQSLGKDLTPAIKKALPHPELAQVREGPEVASIAAARDFAGKEGARFFVFAQCGLVIELLKQCDAHIKFCAHQCEMWLVQTDSNKQLAHAKVTGEKGGSDAVQKLLAQIGPTLEALQEPLARLVAQQQVEREAKAVAERAQRDLQKAESERKLAEERARKAAALAEERARKEGLEGEQRKLAQAEKEAREAKTAEQKKAAQERLALERQQQQERRQAEERAREEARAAALAKQDQSKAAQKARAEEERLRREAEAAGKKLAQERDKRIALEKAQASRVIHLVPGQTVAVLEIENDLQGGARSQVNFQAFTDNLRKSTGFEG